MIDVLLLIVVAIVAVKWFACWIGAKALVKYMADKNYTPPSEDEIKVYCAAVVKKIFHIR